MEHWAMTNGRAPAHGRASKREWGEREGTNPWGLSRIPCIDTTCSKRSFPSRLCAMAPAACHAVVGALVPLPFPLPLAFTFATRASSSGESPCLYGQCGIRVHSLPSAYA